jgi:hypothetical protein
VTALEIDLQQVDGSGNVVTDPTTGLAEVPPNGFSVTVTDSNNNTVASGTTADGSFNVNSGVSASTSYTCTISNPGGASFSTWVSYSASDSSFSCNTGVAGTTTSYTSHWKQAGCTYNSSAANGYLTATVYDVSGNPVPNVKVTLTKLQVQATNPPALTTPGGASTSGQVSWNGSPNSINTGLFSISLSGGGIQAMNNFSTTCIFSGQTSQIYLFTRTVGAVSLTVPVANTYPGGTATLAVEAVDASGNTYEVQQDLDGCGSSCGTGASVVLPIVKNVSYTVTVNCVGVGGITSAPPSGEALYSMNGVSIPGNTSEPLVSVKCPQS